MMFYIDPLYYHIEYVESESCFFIEKFEIRFFFILKGKQFLKKECFHHFSEKSSKLELLSEFKNW